jgi:hypothetical protein
MSNSFPLFRGLESEVDAKAAFFERVSHQACFGKTCFGTANPTFEWSPLVVDVGVGLRHVATSRPSLDIRHCGRSVAIQIPYVFRTWLFILSLACRLQGTAIMCRPRLHIGHVSFLLGATSSDNA